MEKKSSSDDVITYSGASRRWIAESPIKCEKCNDELATHEIKAEEGCASSRMFFCISCAAKFMKLNFRPSTLTIAPFDEYKKYLRDRDKYLSSDDDISRDQGVLLDDDQNLS